MQHTPRCCSSHMACVNDDSLYTKTITMRSPRLIYFMSLWLSCQIIFLFCFRTMCSVVAGHILIMSAKRFTREWREANSLHPRDIVLCGFQFATQAKYIYGTIPSWFTYFYMNYKYILVENKGFGTRQRLLKKQWEFCFRFKTLNTQRHDYWSFIGYSNFLSPGKQNVTSSIGRKF